jgi:hypothetical protein
MSSVDLWLPESYRRRQEEVRARGGVVAVTGCDVGLAPVTYGQVREFASGLVIETAFPRLAAFMLVMGPGGPQGPAELRAVQVRAAREFLPSPYRERAIGFLEAGRRDVVFCQEQLLLVMRLVIEHGQPGPPGEIDKPGMARLLLGVTDLMVSGEGLETGPAENIAVALALRRLGLPRGEKVTCEVARWYDLLVTRARAAAGTPGALDLDVLFQATTGLEIEDFLAIAWVHAAPLYSPRSPQDLASAGFHTVLASLQHRYRDPATAAAAAALLIGDVATMRERFARDTADLHRSSLRPFWEHPYIRLDSGRILPVSSELALNRGIRGIYHLLIDQAGKTRGNAGVNELTSFIGRLHEAYLTTLLQRVFASGHHGTFVSEAEVIAANSHGEKPPFDGAIITGDTVVLVEMLTATLRLDTLEKCDPSRYRRDFDHYFKRKTAQLARAVKETGSGRWVIPGVSPASVRRVAPVLASLHPFPLFGPMWNPFRTAFGQPAFGHKATVMPLQLITDEDIEILEAFQGAGSMPITDALTRRTANPAWAESRMTHVIVRAWNLQEPGNPAMYALYKTATTALRDAAARIYEQG